jgi:hypothetical protein
LAETTKIIPAAEPIEKRAVRLTIELAQVLIELDGSEDASSCQLKEGIVEQLAAVARMRVSD